MSRTIWVIQREMYILFQASVLQTNNTFQISYIYEYISDT